VKPIRNAAQVGPTERGAVVHLDTRGMTVRISLMAADIVRVLFVREGGLRLDRTWTVVAHGENDVPWEGRDRLDESSWPVPDFELRQADARAELVTHALSVEIGFSPFRLTWRLPDGRVFASDRPLHPYMLGPGGEYLHAQSRDPEDFYCGLGDKTGPLNLHGRRLRMAMQDSLGFDPRAGDPLYKHWPFLLVRDAATGAGYGVYYDNCARSVFDLGCERNNYYGTYRSYEARDGDLDYYVILGPDLGEVTRKFLGLTGRPALPPRWSLGFAQTAMAIADAPDAQAQIEALIARCQAEAIPLSAFHLGSGYTMRDGQRYVFTWNSAKYPDPRRLASRAHAAGVRLVANIKPCLLDDHPAFGEVAAAGGFIRDTAGAPVMAQFWDGEGAHADFTSPAGVAWWQNGLAEQVLAVGIDAGWNDNNEYNLIAEDAVCDCFGRPVPLDLVRGVQPLLMTRATVERQRSAAPGERAFTVTRAGCAGIQRYAQTWSGDNTTNWDNLRWNLRTGLQMSLSGMVNTGHDIGGFTGLVPDAELLIRWTQAGLVHPRFIMNSWKPGGIFTSPWLHEEALPAIRKAIEFRLQLMPTIYSLVHRAASHGELVIRPTFLQWGQDARTWEDCDELMLGPFLLAAPVVVPGQRARRVYLPEGPECWSDFWTEERLRAGTETVVPAPLDRLPLAVPAGAVVPMTAAVSDHDEPSRCVRVYPGPGSGESSFVVVEDDGISAVGPASEVRIELSWTRSEVRVGVDVSGGFTLPYDRIAVRLPEAERRRVELGSSDDAVRLVRDPERRP
jgi:alpha-glucosidase